MFLNVRTSAFTKDTLKNRFRRLEFFFGPCIRKICRAFDHLVARLNGRRTTKTKNDTACCHPHRKAR